MRSLILLLAAISVAGCEQLAPIKQPPVGAGLKASVSQERLAQGTTNVAIRTFESTGDNSRQEITGARCNVESDEVRASIVTPQEVIVPDFKQRREFPNRGLPSALVVTCQAGEKSGVTSVTSQEKQVSTVAGGGIAAAIVVAAASAAIATATPWVYPPAVNVTVQ